MTESTSSKRSIVAENFLKRVDKLSTGRQTSDKYFGVIKNIHRKTEKKSRMFSVSRSTVIPSGAHSISSIRSYINAWKEEPALIDNIRSSEVLA